MKNILTYITLLCISLIVITSCVEDDAEPTFVSTADLNLETFTSVVANDTIGTIFGTSNMGSVTYSIKSQTPTGAVKVDNLGNIIVDDASAFKIENSTVSAEIAVGNGNVEKVSNVNIAILTCPDITSFTEGDIIFTSAFSDVSFVTGESLTGNTCAVVYTGEDPLFTFLGCDEEASITITLSPSADDPTIGTLNIERQPYGCSEADNNFEVEGAGEYDISNNLFTFDYTLFQNGSEWDSSSVTVANERDGDNDGDGITNGEERDNATDEEDPCDPMQSPGYSDYNPDSFVWGDADCDDDGIINFDEYDNGTDPYEFTESATDTDGDGISDDDEILDGTDENNPCDPAQSAGYFDYDPDNAIWAAADCDGDGTSNGDEDLDGTDPYEIDGGPCTNDADTLIWEGNLQTIDTFTTETGSGISATSGCGSLSITGDWLPLNFCGGDAPTSTITFTPSAADDGTGTVTLARQTYQPCDFINYEVEGTGTYDENTSLMTISWKIYDVDFDPADPESEGNTEIRPM